MLSPFAETLHRYLRAGYPALAVITHEEERLLTDLRTLREARWPFVTWTMSKGWADADGSLLNKGLGDPLRAVQVLGDLPERTLAVFFDIHPYLGQVPELVRAVRDHLPMAKATQRPILLCSPALSLPVELEKDVALLDYPLPAREALRALLDELIGPAKIAVPPDIRAAMLDAARGLTWNEAENAFALALMRDRARVDQMPGTVQGEKTALVRKSGLLELLTPSETLEEVGGLAVLKAWLASQGALLARAAEALAWGFAPRDLPKGVLLLGPPGTGKSLVARAIAGTWDLPLLRLEMARVLGSLVGQSEASTQGALRLADAMAPCVLHVDEIEKALAGAGAGHLDSGVTSRVVGALLTWLQERGLGPDGIPAPVFVVATANRIEALPPELFRPGRFDQVFFLDLPDIAERRAVVDIHLRARRQCVPAAAVAALAQVTEEYSAAELEQVVKVGCLRAFQDGGRALSAEDLEAARRQVTRLARSRPEEIHALREWAGRRAQRANSALPSGQDTPPAPGRRRLSE
jgi:ATPase family associated with various cellular activities (AAA)